MKGKLTYKTKLLIAFILILIITTLSFQLLFENSSYKRQSVQHAYSYPLLLLFCAIGYVGWRDCPVKWAAPLWVFSYLVVFAIVVLFKVVDVYVYKMPLQISVTYKLRNIFITPLPFIFLYLVTQKIQKDQLHNSRGKTQV